MGFLGSAMGIAIADRKNRCDFGAQRNNVNLWKTDRCFSFEGRGLGDFRLSSLFLKCFRVLLVGVLVVSRFFSH